MIPASGNGILLPVQLHFLKNKGFKIFGHFSVVKQTNGSGSFPFFQTVAHFFHQAFGNIIVDVELRITRNF